MNPTFTDPATKGMRDAQHAAGRARIAAKLAARHFRKGRHDEAAYSRNRAREWAIQADAAAESAAWYAAQLAREAADVDTFDTATRILKLGNALAATHAARAARESADEAARVSELA